MKILLSAILFAFVLVSVAEAQTPVLLRAHEATYAMKQIRKFSRQPSDVEHAEGVLRYKFTQSCDGWMVEHNTAMQMEFSTAQQIQMTWSYTSWEAKDGSKLRFRSTTKQNGRVTERYQGEARRENGKTVAIYAEPNGRRLEMPKDVLFPTNHQLQSLQAALDGEVLFLTPYFDGSGEDGNFDVSAVLTPFKGEPLTRVEDVDLPKTKTWDIQLAFFEPESQSSQPELEISARYRQDGVSTRLVHDFGDFVLEGELVEFKYLSEPACN